MENEAKQQVREAMETVLRDSYKFDHTGQFMEAISGEGIVNRLFNLTYSNGQPMLAMLAEKQEESLVKGWSEVKSYDFLAGYYGGQREMLNAGWRRQL